MINTQISRKLYMYSLGLPSSRADGLPDHRLGYAFGVRSKCGVSKDSDVLPRIPRVPTDIDMEYISYFPNLENPLWNMQPWGLLTVFYIICSDVGFGNVKGSQGRMCIRYLVCLYFLIWQKTSNSSDDLHKDRIKSLRHVPESEGPVILEEPHPAHS
jgi:hypothetical protein